MAMTDCPMCGNPMPAARLTIPIANGVCGTCNVNRPAKVYRQALFGFKNNGVSLIAVESYSQAMEGVKVRG